MLNVKRCHVSSAVCGAPVGAAVGTSIDSMPNMARKRLDLISSMVTASSVYGVTSMSGVTHKQAARPPKCSVAGMRGSIAE